MRTKAIAMFDSIEAAQKVQARLQEFGIPAQIDGDKPAVFSWSRGADAWIKIVVPHYCARDVEAFALRLHEGDHLLGEALHCPRCGSLRIESRPATRQALVPGMTWLYALGWLRNGIFCRDCYKAWSPESPRSRMMPTHPLETWPYANPIRTTHHSNL